jgi:hypothetical protein
MTLFVRGVRRRSAPPARAAAPTPVSHCPSRRIPRQRCAPPCS